MVISGRVKKQTEQMAVAHIFSAGSVEHEQRENE